MRRAAGIPRTRPGVRRTAELRFGQPYAVVAVTTGPDHNAGRRTATPRPWRGLPVFSAWITQPEDADDPARRRRDAIMRIKNASAPHMTPLRDGLTVPIQHRADMHYGHQATCSTGRWPLGRAALARFVGLASGAEAVG
jgi:hypothetical protein